MIAAFRNEAALFLLALQFLTRVPLPANIGFTPARMAASARYYPLIGILIGAFAAGVFWAAHLAVTKGLAVLLSAALTCALTGAFHEDGLADSFDGIGGGLTREAALKIMKDSRIGTYGAAALGFVLALKIGALCALPPLFIICALIAGHGLSRLSAVLVIATSRYVRDHGTGKPTASGMSRASLTVALITGAACFAGLYNFLPVAALIGGAAGLAAGHIIMRLFFERKLGGYTGDCLGAVQQLSEMGFYLGVLSCL